MAKKAGLFLTLCLGVSGCGGIQLVPSRAADPAFAIGTSSSEASANGLAFSDGSQVVQDVEGQEMTVRLVRFQRDVGTGATRLVVTEETVTLPATFTDYDSRDAVMTLDGEPLIFVDGAATLPNGQDVWAYMNYRMTYSGTGAIYAYSSFDPDATDPVDLEGFYAFGFETAPDAIAALSGRASYAGSYFGYVQILDLEDAIIDEEVRTAGAIALEADFNRDRVSGRLAGRLEADAETTEYEMIFLGAPIEGNGFVGAADLTCGTGAVCISNTNVGGAFFGPDGAEVSGVIGFDETITEDGTGLRIVGAAGFSSQLSD